MWRFILTASLLCWGSEGTVTCKDNNNGDVDWYIIYKAPKLNNQGLTGLEYVYIDPAGAKIVIPSRPNYKPINDPSGVLANTLQPIFTSIRSMSPNFGFISYSDQPPGCIAESEKFGHSKAHKRAIWFQSGHAKNRILAGSLNAAKGAPDRLGQHGVLMVDKTSTGVWLSHSTPRFPYRRNQDHFFPESGEKNAQMFICTTFSYDLFKQIGNHLRYIRAFPFEHDLPGDFHEELRKAADWDTLEPLHTFQSLITNGGNTFYSAAKKKISEQPVDGDLYITIAQAARSDVFVQTWGRQADRSPSFCQPPIYEVLNVESIGGVTGDWIPSCDHSKWCVALNTPWVCIADLNRSPSQFKRYGGAICIQNDVMAGLFRRFVLDIDDCRTQRKNYNNLDCESVQIVHIFNSTMG